MTGTKTTINAPVMMSIACLSNRLLDCESARTARTSSLCSPAMSRETRDDGFVSEQEDARGGWVVPLSVWRENSLLPF